MINAAVAEFEQVDDPIDLLDRLSHVDECCCRPLAARLHPRIVALVAAKCVGDGWTVSRQEAVAAGFAALLGCCPLALVEDVVFAQKQMEDARETQELEDALNLPEARQ